MPTIVVKSVVKCGALSNHMSDVAQLLAGEQTVDYWGEGTIPSLTAISSSQELGSDLLQEGGERKRAAEDDDE